MGCAWHLAALLLLLSLSAAAFGAPDSSKYKLDFSTELRMFPQEAFDPRHGALSQQRRGQRRCDVDGREASDSSGDRPTPRDSC